MDLLQVPLSMETLTCTNRPGTSRPCWGPALTSSIQSVEASAHSGDHLICGWWSDPPIEMGQSKPENRESLLPN